MFTFIYMHVCVYRYICINAHIHKYTHEHTYTACVRARTGAQERTRLNSNFSAIKELDTRAVCVPQLPARTTAPEQDPALPLYGGDSPPRQQPKRAEALPPGHIRPTSKFCLA